MQKLTRYQEILSLIKNRIQTGDYSVGSNLPSEASFCKEFGASRFTIRESLRIIELDGLIKRKQGSCRTVIRKTPIETFVQNFESVADLVQFAYDTDYRMLSNEKVLVTEKIASALDAEIDEIWTCQKGLRLDRSSLLPFALVETYIAPSIETFSETIMHKKPPFFTYLEEKTGLPINSIEQEIQALHMPLEVTKHLDVSKNSLSLRVLRRYKSNYKTLLASFNWHLGEERFILSSYLKNIPVI